MAGLGFLMGALLVSLGIIINAVTATPNVAFPFNSQVPTVARAGAPYLFQFSASTFAPETSNFTYSISSQPAWLTMDGLTRTLSGTPDESEVGASTFTLTAADETGVVHTGCTLVVSADPAPQLEGDISEQIAATANLSSTEPPTVTVLPSTSFHFSFQPNSFIDIVQRKLYYYATLSDHTPLPSWLLFDAMSMTFSGTAPMLSAFPQLWNVNLIASDVAGFAGATASFTIAIGTQQLAFVPAAQDVNITSGTRLDFIILQKQLYRNGTPLPVSSLADATATGLPPWASFDPSTLSITGRVPSAASDASISVTVTDKQGNSATTVVTLVSGTVSLFHGSIGTLTAYAGQAFTYRFSDSLFSGPSMDLSVILPATATWLHFDQASHELQGTVPSQTAPTSIVATLAARTTRIGPAQKQAFIIDIREASTSTIGTIQPTGRASPTNSSTPVPLPVAAGTGSQGRMSAGTIAAIVISCVLAAVLLLVLLIFCLRRRRQDGYESQSATPVKKSLISRPIQATDNNAITVTTELQRDVEKAADSEDWESSARDGDQPPQIALNLPSRATSRRSRWLNRFSHISQVSSLGNGEDAIRADSNIPEWGAESAALHTPHDSFSVPAEIARVSRQLSQSSPTKRAMRRIRERQKSRQSFALGIDTGQDMLMPRHSSKQSRSYRRDKSSLGLSATFDRSSQASISTRGTSLLSTKPSDFPRPPTRSTGTLSRSIPTLSVTDPDQLKSIRLVGRSDSITDNRSVQEKRQSFIRNRASTSLQSPLFSHGSRAPSITTKQTGNDSIAASSSGSARRSRHVKSTLTSYSESSSLEPQRESRRLSAKVRSVFAPSYPRAITQSSLGADDEAAGDDRDSDSGFETVSESMSEEDWRTQMTLPRHQRPFVLPGEASPTPPPAPPTSRQPSSGGRRSAYSPQTGATRQKWKERAKGRSSSPLATAVAVSAADRSSLSAQGNASQIRRSRLSEPIDLASKDSINRPKTERPRLVHTSSGRPVSVESVKRLSSFRAEAGTETDTQAGSEMEGSGLVPTAVIESREYRAASREPIDIMKFGKHIQKRQLDIPEYASSFVDYKALKKLIKRLSATPVLPAQQATIVGEALPDAQAALQANRATFFFRLERELEKVNIFYLQKEAELKLRLRTLLDKKRALESRATPASKLSSSYVTLDEGFRMFGNDLDKLQQFVSVNQTAFSKILKKWDKTSKSRTKELYLSRAVDVQPCFNRDVISDLSDQATTGLLELQAWAEGEKITYTPAVDLEGRAPASGQDEEVETQVLHAINAGNGGLVREWASRMLGGEEAKERISRVFLNSISSANPDAQRVLYETDAIDFNYADEINERNCVHEAAVSNKVDVLRAALAKGANIRAPDVYGRTPLHYACMHGNAEMIQILVAAAPDTVDVKDLDNFTPLIHGIVHAQAASVQAMLQLGALVNPTGTNDHVPLDLACQYGTVAIVEQMLQYNPEILPDAEGLFPQHLVARFGGDKQILVMLKAYGVDMDQADKLYSWTPIFHAASEGHLECLQQLLEFHVKANAVDEKGLSAMYYAAWEGNLDCMQLLAQEGATSEVPIRDATDMQMGLSQPPPLSTGTPAKSHIDAENIPDLSLPPPIIPLRRYGHNFLDTTKTFILLSFDDLNSDAIEFYGDSKYPAARLTISSKSSDLIPRNVPLPVQDDFKHISFQIENLSTFSIDFDIYPTFGSKVIARAAASSRVFTGTSSSSGIWHLELFDPRLRAFGRISFRYQVVTPFHGIPLEITHFATYWKATSQFENHPSNLITGSSLSGDFMRLFVQCTRDGVPVLFNDWALPSSRNDLVSRMTYEELAKAGLDAGRGKGVIQGMVGSGIEREDLASAQRQVARSYASLSDALAVLPADLNLDLHICYPTRNEEESLQLGPTQNINAVADAVLTVVFDHARQLREQKDSPLRNFVFSSYNAEVCTALNWKQPNYPTLLCNELGVAPKPNGQRRNPSMVSSCGRASTSIKEAVRIAQSNNFMGLICTSRLLELVPALVSSIKEAGLVLISDYSHDSMLPHPRLLDLPKAADGLLMDNAVLRFKEAVEQ
ncbi:phosphate system positive regulatory protein pho81 [Elasticomyces elasticus]|nr:phosphate system positive regulatory protein pho81 [Elasticomyces elasticus]